MNNDVIKYDLRHAGWDDTEYIAMLSDQLGYVSTPEKMRHRLSGIFDNKDHCIFVAVHKIRIVGWIHGFRTLRVESDPFVEIGGLVVDVEYRGSGIGTELVEKVKEWAGRQQIRKLRVRCNVTRKRTHDFYCKMGFSETKDQKVLDLCLK